MRPIRVSYLLALLAVAALLGLPNLAGAKGRRIFWSETELQGDDPPIPQSKRIWARESGDEPAGGYYNVPTPLTEAPIVDGLSKPGGLYVDVLGGHIYWADSETRLISRSDLDGDNVQSLTTTPEGTSPQAVVYDTLTELVIVSFFPRTGLAIDVLNRKLYWGVAIDGEIRRSNVDLSDDGS